MFWVRNTAAKLLLQVERTEPSVIWTGRTVFFRWKSLKLQNTGVKRKILDAAFTAEWPRTIYVRKYTYIFSIGSPVLSSGSTGAPGLWSSETSAPLHVRVALLILHGLSLPRLFQPSAGCSWRLCRTLFLRLGKSWSVRARRWLASESVVPKLNWFSVEFEKVAAVLLPVRL